MRSKIAYIMSRFPKITETFILYEMLELERQGMDIEIFPLLRERGGRVHPEAAPLVARARFAPFLSWQIMLAHLHFLARMPRTYFEVLGVLLRANWGSARYFFGALAFFPKIVYFAYLMSQQRISHVHAHFASHPAAAAFVIHKLTGITYSFTAHGSDLHRDRHMLREKVAAASLVVAISEYNRQLILDECGQQFSNRVEVIHCGVDTTIFRWPGRRSAEPARPFTILCVGTLHEVKGQAYLLEACRLLVADNVDFVCHLVGDGPDGKALQQQANRAGLSTRVCFHGRQTRNEIARLLEQSDVLVAPSVPAQDGRREGIPVVLMEAMASQVAVIASGISGIPELVHDQQTGLLIPPRNAPALARAIGQLCHHPQLRRQLARAGRELVLREFNLTTNAAALAERFRGLTRHLTEDQRAAAHSCPNAFHPLRLARFYRPAPKDSL